MRQMILIFLCLLFFDTSNAFLSTTYNINNNISVSIHSGWKEIPANELRKIRLNEKPLIGFQSSVFDNEIELPCIIIANNTKGKIYNEGLANIDLNQQVFHDRSDKRRYDNIFHVVYDEKISKFAGKDVRLFTAKVLHESGYLEISLLVDFDSNFSYSRLLQQIAENVQFDQSIIYFPEDRPPGSERIQIGSLSGLNLGTIRLIAYGGGAVALGIFIFFGKLRRSIFTLRRDNKK